MTHNHGQCSKYLLVVTGTNQSEGIPGGHCTGVASERPLDGGLQGSSKVGAEEAKAERSTQGLKKRPFNDQFKHLSIF